MLRSLWERTHTEVFYSSGKKRQENCQLQMMGMNILTGEM